MCPYFSVTLVDFRFFGNWHVRNRRVIAIMFDGNLKRGFQCRLVPARKGSTRISRLEIGPGEPSIEISTVIILKTIKYFRLIIYLLLYIILFIRVNMTYYFPCINVKTNNIKE